jgi:hypothetical protein
MLPVSKKAGFAPPIDKVQFVGVGKVTVPLT